MKAMNLVVRIMLRMGFLCCCIAFVVIIVRLFSSPTLYSVNLTGAYMRSMAVVMEYAMESAGHSNIVEYVNSITSTQRIPQIMDCEVIRRIRKEALCFDDEDFRDAWGQPIMITLTTNRNGAIKILMHSFGKNKRNENGNGDDIQMWFNANMSQSAEDFKTPK